MKVEDRLTRSAGAFSLRIRANELSNHPSENGYEVYLQQSSQIFAVMPAHKEEVTIGSVVLQALESVDHLIVVDRGSSGRTAQVAALASALVLNREKNHEEEREQ